MIKPMTKKKPRPLPACTDFSIPRLYAPCVVYMLYASIRLTIRYVMIHFISIYFRNAISIQAMNTSVAPMMTVSSGWWHIQFNIISLFTLPPWVV